MPSPASPAGTAEVGTAMPTVVGDLGGLDHMAWVVTGYTLATACSTPVWGKLGDLFPRKTVFLTSIELFLAASVLCGAAPSMNWLIAFRVLQGLGAGGLAAGAFALIGVLLPPRERGRYQGPVAAVMAVGQLGGPLVGGFVTAHLGWRWAFYVNVPAGLVCVAWCWVTLRVPAPGPRGRAVVDWRGIALLTGAVSAFVMAATWAGSVYAWGSWQIVSLAVLALALLAAFVASERRAPEPLMPLRIHQGHRNFPLAAVLLTRQRRLPLRRHALPAALPAGRPVGLGRRLRPAPAADDDRHARHLEHRGQGHDGHRPVQNLPGPRLRAPGRRQGAPVHHGHRHLTLRDLRVHGRRRGGHRLHPPDGQHHRPERLDLRDMGAASGAAPAE
ncbi:MFS transporter [Streptomyces koyangensis]|uniref:MFS transporter n=1 Tax=Streptomyces koyangensis TaxID=188770 RepID=UPI00216ACC56|nr:MFS transporter [Streptomyces koyangensis]